jgi:hypothetical protein
MKFVRNNNFNNKILIIDGQGGCGKTLFSQICSSFKRIEIFSYAFELEFITKLYNFKKIEKNAASTLIKMLVDHKLYQNMMGREVNFRYKDLSSVFNHPYPLEYFKRIFSKGDRSIPKKISTKKPILNLTCHDLFFYSNILFETFGDRLVFFEIVRHPLYMVIQQHINEKELDENVRDIQLKFLYKNKQVPYYAFDYLNQYSKANTMDRAVLAINNFTKKNNYQRNFLKNKTYKLLTIPFEKFVIYPEKYLDKMCDLLGTKFGNKTKKVLLKNRVPRKNIEDGINLEVYKRYGWKKSIMNTSFEKEKEIRINYLKENNISQKCLDIILDLSKKYENENIWFK